MKFVEPSRPFRHLWLLYLAVDIVAVVAAYYTAVLFRFHEVIGEEVFGSLNRILGIRSGGAIGPGIQDFYIAGGPRIITFLALTLCPLYALRDLYPGRRFIRPRPVGWHVVAANATAMLLYYVYFHVRRNVYHPRSLFPTILFLNAIFCTDFRSLLDRFMDWLRRRCHADECPAILIGFNREADALHDYLQAERPLGIHVVHRLAFDPARPFAEFEKEAAMAARDHAETMIIAADPQLSIGQIMRVLELADSLDLPSKVLSGHLEVLASRARLPIDMIHGIPLVHFEAPSTRRRYGVVTRAVSFGLAAVATVLLLPVLAVVALVIKLTSRGPVFFIQDRIGINRRPFRMFKFRTMYERADAIQAELEKMNESGEGLFKIRRDPRVTKFGRALRRVSLDEAPQLLNVIRGEMTLVGPRPLPRRDFENYYEEWHYGRHGGLPGLTCLWQVSGRSDLDFHSMCILDVYYLRNQSWTLDLKIVWRTIWVVLFARGAY